MSNKIDNLNKAKETRDDELYTSVDAVKIIYHDLIEYNPVDWFNTRRVFMPCDGLQSQFVKEAPFRNVCASDGYSYVYKTGEYNDLDFGDDDDIPNFETGLLGSFSEYLASSNLLITNPPFSKLRCKGGFLEAIDWWVQNEDHDILLILPLTCIGLPIIAKWLKNKRFDVYPGPKKFTRPDGSIATVATIVLTTLDFGWDSYKDPLDIQVKGPDGDFKGFMGYYEDKRHIEYPCYYFNQSEDVCLRTPIRDDDDLLYSDVAVPVSFLYIYDWRSMFDFIGISKFNKNSFDCVVLRPRRKGYILRKFNMFKNE